MQNVTEDPYLDDLSCTRVTKVVHIRACGLLSVERRVPVNGGRLDQTESIILRHTAVDGWR